MEGRERRERKWEEETDGKAERGEEFKANFGQGKMKINSLVNMRCRQ